MTQYRSDKSLENPLSGKNWEYDIRRVKVEPCEPGEDPLGYKAVFFLNQESARAHKKKSFAIGASFLAQRKHNLDKAGYQAPMTHQAIELVESKIGDILPLFGPAKSGCPA